LSARHGSYSHTNQGLGEFEDDPEANKLLKSVSKVLLDMQCHFGLLPTDRQGMSVIAFSSPAMRWEQVMEHVLCSLR
jgi:hypothetical protein